MVIDGCDVDRALYEVLVGAYLTAGQRHNSTGRVIVTEPIFDALLREFTARAKRLNVGSAFDANSFMGPVISENYRTRFRRYGHALESRGHQTLLPAVNREVAGFRGYYASPSVFVVDWQNGHAFLNDEPPGPTLLFYRVPGWEEAVALHNKLQYRLSTALFIRPDHPALGEIVGRLKSGSLNVNRGTIGSSMRLPSVGLGRSANGVPGGIDLLRFLATPRSTLVETRPFHPLQAVPGVNWPRSAGQDEVEVEVDPL
jgi:succinylglutamic semialdehyde dehydrogenase